MYICRLFQRPEHLHYAKVILISLLFVSAASAGRAQTQQNQLSGFLTGGDRLNTITTAVPFLMISPDSRAGGMGDIGAATSPDVHSAHWNAAKLVKADRTLGVGASFTPWLRELVSDIYLSYLTGYKKLTDNTVVGGSMRYFSLGDIIFTDNNGNTIRPFRPNEFALDAFVGTRLTDYISGAVAFRFINSNLTGGIPVAGAATKPGRSVAADISSYFEYPDLKLGGYDAEIAAGIAITNIGGKMSYSNNAGSDFLPMNLRLGPRLTVNLDDYNSITWAFDLNKLLVPTPPIYKTDATGNLVTNADGLVIGAGQDPDRPLASGLFGSFSDAPGTPLFDDQGNYLENPDGTYQVEKGSRLKEEMREINFATGLEYWYDNQFAVRGGYFHESALKGNRKYMTFGAGLRFNVFGIDAAYLIPAYFGSDTPQSNPLKNTWRISLTFDFDGLKEQNNASQAGDS